MRVPFYLLLMLSFAQIWGCGAKTGLPIPENTTCREIELQRPIPQALFVIDQSGSMDFSLEGIPAPDRGATPSRWELMSVALQASLASRPGTLQAGAVFFPQLIVGGVNGCGGREELSIEPSLDSLPAFRQVFSSEVPNGGTPTGAGLRVARLFFEEPAPDTVPFVVLITDGAPNCNPDHPTRPMCTCTSPETQLCDPDLNDDAALQCLDDSNALEEIGLLQASGVPVYVLGISRERELSDVLDRFAIAGGRPRPDGARRFYNAQSEAELGAAFDSITSSITSCSFSIQAPRSADRMRVLIDGSAIPRDRTHMNGWDFFGDGNAHIALYGAACAQAELGTTEVTADAFCDIPDAGTDLGRPDAG